MEFEEALRELIARHIEAQGTQGIQDALSKELAIIKDNERELLDSPDEWNALRDAYLRLAEKQEG
jgi:hypothetical protein